MWILYSFAAALAATITNTIRKRETVSDHHDVINLFTFSFAVPVLFITNLVLGFPIISPQYWWFFAGHLLVDFLAFSFYVRALKYSEMSLVTPFISFTAVFTALVSPFLLNETISLTGIAGIVFILIGAYYISASHKNTSFWFTFKSIFSNRGIIFALTASFFWSLGAVFLRYGQSYSSVLFHPLMVSAGLAMVLGLKVVIQDKLKLLSVLKKDMAGHAGLGLSFSADTIFVSLALSTGTVAYAIALKQVSMLFDIVAGKAIFHEHETKKRLVAGLIIISGIVLIIFYG